MRTIQRKVRTILTYSMLEHISYVETLAKHIIATYFLPISLLSCLPPRDQSHARRRLVLQDQQWVLQWGHQKELHWNDLQER